MVFYQKTRSTPEVVPFMVICAEIRYLCHFWSFVPGVFFTLTSLNWLYITCICGKIGFFEKRFDAVKALLPVDFE